MADETNSAATSQSSTGSTGQPGATGGSAGQTGGSAQTSASTSSSASTAAPTRPDWAPEAAWDAKAGFNADAFGKHWAEKIAPVLTRDAAEQVRRAALPATAEDYKLGTTASFKPPEGIEFKLNEADPQWSQARAWAHKHGLSQDAFHEAVDLFAGTVVGDAQRMKAARDAEVAKLGATGVARVGAVETFLDAAGVPELKSGLFTGAHVAAFERLIAKVVSQGAAPAPRGSSQQDGAPGRVSQDAYDKMSPAERWDYARSHNQAQMPAWRDPR